MDWKPLVTERHYNRGVPPAPANRKRKKHDRTCAVSPGPAFLSLQHRFAFCFKRETKQKKIKVSLE